MKTCSIYHTRFGNNAALAEKMNELLVERGDVVSMHQISDSKPSAVPEAELYIVGAPTQIGTLPLKASRFLKRLNPPEGNSYAVFFTHAEAESGVPEKIASIMEGNGAVSAAESLSISVKDLKGPLQDDWENRLKDWIGSL